MTNSSEFIPPLRWPARLGLLALSVLLLSLALAPVYQFYLAWVGLVPWFFVIASTRTKKAAFLWSWLGGTLFFFANMWWLWKVTIPGMFALLIYLGLFWGFAAWIFVGCRFIPRFHDRSIAFSRVFSIAMIAVVFTALEWVRGNWSMFGNQGLPWLYLGNTQSPFLTMCQVAEIGGVYAVTFWVVLVNAAIFCAIVEPRIVNRISGPVGFPLAVLALIGIYGAFTNRIYSDARGPNVVVVQPNYPQSNSGEKGAPLAEIIRFHVETTKAALIECEKKGIKIDLIVWSETMMPALNSSAQEYRRFYISGDLWKRAIDEILNLANESGANLIVGGMYWNDWQIRSEGPVPADRRNSAYFFERGGVISDKRYDKIHLVPFGEFIPYDSIPFIHSVLMKLGPSGYEDYVLTPGDENAMTVFELPNEHGEPSRFVVPICFEDIVGPLCAKMVRGPDGTKRADFLVNVTNDGWFTGGQMSQHLQAAVFRSIENRVPTARAVNTGVSGFIDSTGRVFNTVPAKTEGWSVGQLKIDPRVTFYTKHGDLFVEVCAIITSIVIVARIVRVKPKRPQGTTT